MRRYGVWVALMSVGSTFGSSDILAQADPGCQVFADSVGGTGVRQLSSGRIRFYAGGGVWWSCVDMAAPRGRDAVVWRSYSDSVTRYVELGRIDFIGAVEFNDSTVQLTATRASYYERDDRLEAFGNVRLVNRETGSVLRGSNLTYWRPLPGVRDLAELVARRRPTVEYRSVGDSGEPYVIVGDEIRMEGNSAAWASGDVTIDRSDFSARGDSSELRLEGGLGSLIGNAEAGSLEDAGYTLLGDRIDYRMIGDDLRWVQSQGSSSATSAMWSVVGDTLEFDVFDDMIQSGLAWGDSTRPEAISETYTITADSLAIDLPNQQLDEVRGFGNAIATSLDSLSGENDWMVGDTVVASFDSTATGQRTMSTLMAAGDARAFYHIYDAENPGIMPGINYARGERITALFKDDTVDRVDVVGQADGVYLEPQRRRVP